MVLVAFRSSLIVKINNFSMWTLQPQNVITFQGKCVHKGQFESHFQFVKMHFSPCQVVQRINSIYCTKRGKKRLKKLSLSNIETASLRGKDFYHDVRLSECAPVVHVVRWPFDIHLTFSLFVDDNSESESDSDDRFKGEGSAHMAERAVCLSWALLFEQTTSHDPVICHK